jgi:hypothetical protein
MMDQKIVPLLISPINGEQVAEIAESGNQEDARAGKWLIDLQRFRTMPMQIRPLGDLLGHFPRSAMSTKEGTCFDGDHCILVDDGKVLTASCDRVTPLSAINSSTSR